MLAVRTTRPGSTAAPCRASSAPTAARAARRPRGSGRVVEAGRAGERREEVVRVAQAGPGRVGAGQVDQRNPLILQGISRRREPVEGESGDPVRPQHECYNTALPAGGPGIARPGPRSLDDVDQDGPRLARPRVRGDGRVHRGADEPHFPWGRSCARRQRLDRVDHQRDHQQRQHHRDAGARPAHRDVAALPRQPDRRGRSRQGADRSAGRGRPRRRSHGGVLAEDRAGRQSVHARARPAATAGPTAT